LAGYAVSTGCLHKQYLKSYKAKIIHAFYFQTEGAKQFNITSAKKKCNKMSNNIMSD